VSLYQKGKITLDLLEQEILSGSGITWAICKYAPRPKQITMWAPHHSVSYRTDALPADHTHTHTTVLLLVWSMSGSTRVSRHQNGKTKKVKTNLDLLEQEIVSGSGICWAICKSAPHADNHANIPPLSFLQAGCPSCRPTNSVKALKAQSTESPALKAQPFLLTNQQQTVSRLVWTIYCYSCSQCRSLRPR